MTRIRFRAFAVSALILAAFTCEAAAQTMVIATDRQGSLMNRVGTAMAKTITDNSKLRAVVRPFAGPDAFMAALDSGELKVAVLTASSTYTEFRGLTKLKKPRKNIRILRSGPNVLRLGFIVHADSDIKLISQIKGRKLTSDFGGHAVLPRSIAAGLSNGGLTWDDVVKVPVTGVVDGVKTVGAGRAESSWAAVGMPAVREIHAQKPVRFLSFDDDPAKVAKMREIMFPGLKLVRFPKPVPPLAIAHPVNVITYDTYLLAHKSLDSATAGAIVEALWKGTDALIKSSPIFGGFKRENSVTTLPMAPYHPAAVAFYKGKGLWTDAAMKANDKISAMAK
ncbi:MAG: TAXI family TRAP transporter solute-binding subunit [Rhodospirillales bacterium]|nr:TAXI family TRAP transporter solute-binding subunit [Rhodospirillales bacterium]